MNIFITGTSSGIGNALALEYLKNGHTVYGISRRLNENLKKVERYHHLKLDLGDLEIIENTIVSWIRKLDKIDLAILNAGVLPEINDMVNTSMDEIQRVMNVNVWSNKILIDCLTKHTDVRQVVAISSGAAISGSRGWNAYSLSKSALNMLIDLYSKEVTETHFIAMAPGVIDTAMQDYIYGLPEEKSYPVVKRLKNMKGTDDMPDASMVASRLAKAIKQAFHHESGSFIDIREMNII